MDYHPEEFIGLKLKVIRATNKSLEGISGMIIDETKKSFRIRAPDGEKMILKQGTILIINGKELRGDALAQRPEERIKKR